VRRRARPQEGGGNLGLWLGLAGGGLLLLAGGVVALVLVLNKDKTSHSQAKTKDSKDGKGAGGGGGGENAGWTPNAAFLGDLAPETQVQGYRLRPPKGYSFQQRAVLNGTLYIWKGITRPNGSSPGLIMTINPVPPLELANTTLDQQFSAFLTSFKNSQRFQVPDLANTASEHGEIDGVKFVRCRLTGNVVGKGKLHGFCYLGIVGSNLISMTSVDFEPHDQTTLRVAETAALTFKKS
jgi:hypothetical protein